MLRTRNRLLAPPLAALAVVAILLVASGCGGTSSDAAGGDGSGGKLTLVAYSTPEEAYRELIPAFNKTPDGKGVGFSQSYASSGEQSRAVEGACGRTWWVLDRARYAGLWTPTRDKGWNQKTQRQVRTRSGLHGPQGQPRGIRTGTTCAGDVEVSSRTVSPRRREGNSCPTAPNEKARRRRAQQYLAEVFKTCRARQSARESLQRSRAARGLLPARERGVRPSRRAGAGYVSPDDPGREPVAATTGPRIRSSRSSLAPLHA